MDTGYCWVIWDVLAWVMFFGMYMFYFSGFFSSERSYFIFLQALDEAVRTKKWGRKSSRSYTDYCIEFIH